MDSTLCTVVEVLRARENRLLISSWTGVWDCCVGAPLLDSAGLLLVAFTVLIQAPVNILKKLDVKSGAI